MIELSALALPTAFFGGKDLVFGLGGAGTVDVEGGEVAGE